jgi:hypothetical protein
VKSNKNKPKNFLIKILLSQNGIILSQNETLLQVHSKKFPKSRNFVKLKDGDGVMSFGKLSYIITLAVICGFFNSCGKLGNLTNRAESSSQQLGSPALPANTVVVSKNKLMLILGTDLVDLANYVAGGTPAYSYSILAGNTAGNVLNGSMFNPKFAGFYKIGITDSKSQSAALDIDVFDAKVAFDFTRNTTVAKLDGVDTGLLTFSRDAVATYTDSLGIVKYAQAFVPRFGFDVARNLSLGLFIERTAQNLVVASNNFASPPCVYGSVDPLVMSVLLNGATSPDNAISAANVNFAATVGTYVIPPAMPATIGAVYTASMWVKGRAAAAQTTTFKFGGTDAAIKAIPLTDKWVRHSITGTATAASIQFNLDNDANGGMNEINNLSIWGLQVEAGNKPSSYIPTANASLVRSGETAKITLTQNFDPTKGIFVLEFYVNEINGNPYVFGYSQGEFAMGNIADGIYINGKNNLTTLEIRSGGISQSIVGAAPWTLGSVRKVAFSYGPNGIIVYENGVLIGNLNNQTIPVATLISLGSSAGHGNNTQSNQYIRSMKYYSVEGTAKDLEKLSL